MMTIVAGLDFGFAKGVLLVFGDRELTEPADSDGSERACLSTTRPPDRGRAVRGGDGER